jgi:hypothetical protein
MHFLWFMANFDILMLTGKKEKSTKGIIIRCLAGYAELSILQLQHILRKEFSRQVTYQAIRQALLELMRDDVVVKEKNVFRISHAFILDIKDTVDLFERSSKKKMRIIDNQTSQIRLKNLHELGNFVLFGLDQNYFDNRERKELYLRLNHLWIPFSDIQRRDRLVKIFTENKTEVMVKNNSMADRILAKWYRQFGKVTLGTKFAAGECIIHGDCVVQIFMDEELAKKMDKVYSLKGIIRFDLFRQISAMTYDEHPIDLVITRNPKIAQKMRIA